MKGTKGKKKDSRNYRTGGNKVKQSYFIAQCPFEIGDRVIRKHSAQEITEKQISELLKAPVITDIAAIHFVKTGVVSFCYELDNNGVYLETPDPEAKAIFFKGGNNNGSR